MSRLPLLLAAGALWLFLAALPAFADGGPHVAVTNNGSTVLTSDTCAGCHRIHTGKGEYLIVADTETNLCLTCHGPNAAGATTNVVTGVQYTPAASYPSAGWQQRSGLGTDASGTQLGALRAGGFLQARLDQPIRLSNGTSLKGQVPVGVAEATTSAHMHLPTYSGVDDSNGIAWGNGANGSGVGPTVELECTSCHNPHGNGNYRILNPLPTASGATQSVTDPVALNATVNLAADTIITTVGHPFQVGDLVTISGLTITGSPSSPFTVVAVPDGAKFQIGTITVAGGITVFDITASTATSVSRSSAPVTDAPVGTIDPATGYPERTRNYTVIQAQGTQGTAASYLLYADQVSSYGATAGDYFHRAVPFATSSGSDDAPNGVPATVTLAGDVNAGQVGFNTQITAWCSGCHTRYLSVQNPNPNGLDAGSSAASAKGVFADVLSSGTIVTSASHGFVIGDVVTVSGAAGIADGDYTVLTVPTTTAFTVAGLSADSGTRFSISSSDATANTITTSAAHGLSIGDYVLVADHNGLAAGATFNALYYVKTVPSTTTVTLSSKQGGTALDITTNGGAFGTVSVVASQYRVASVDATTETYTTSAAHGLVVGDRVVIGGVAAVTSTNANGAFYVKSVGSTTTFTVSSTSGGATFDLTVSGAWTANTGAVMPSVIRKNMPQTASSWWFPRTDGTTTAGTLNVDPIYTYQHRTVPNRACTTCHVAHGTNAAMTGANSSTVALPNALVSASSRLLKIDNRGTCQVCHDPTSTFGSNNYNSYLAGSPVTITTIDSSGNITATSHGYSKGDVLKIAGNSKLADGIYLVFNVVNANTFQVSTSGAPTATASTVSAGGTTGGTATRITEVVFP